MTPDTWQQRMAQIEELVARAERLPDPSAREIARELTQALLDVHGEGLSRLLAAARQGGELPSAVTDACRQDELLASVLLMHGLHPEPLRVRVDRALARVRPMLARHEGDVELISVDDGIAILRLLGSCKDSPSSTETLKRTVEEALYEEAPDLAGCRVEAPPAPPSNVTLNLVCPERGSR